MSLTAKPDSILSAIPEVLIGLISVASDLLVIGPSGAVSTSRAVESRSLLIAMSDLFNAHPKLRMLEVLRSVMNDNTLPEKTREAAAKTLRSCTGEPFIKMALLRYGTTPSVVASEVGHTIAGVMLGMAVTRSFSMDWALHTVSGLKPNGDPDADDLLAYMREAFAQRMK